MGTDKFVIDLVAAHLNLDMRLLREMAELIRQQTRDSVNMHFHWRQIETEYMTATQGDLVEEFDYNMVVSQLAEKRYRHDFE